MTALFIILGFALIGIGILAHLVRNAPEDPDEGPISEKYDFKIEEYPDQPDSADVCLYIDGCYDSLSYVWKKRDGAWKYGGNRHWAGHAATKEMAIEISKRWLIRDAETRHLTEGL